MSTNRKIATPPVGHPDHLHTFGSRGVCQFCTATRGTVYAELGQLEAGWVVKPVDFAAPDPEPVHPAPAEEPTCDCGHGHSAHLHYRPGANCSALGCSCPKFQRSQQNWLKGNWADMVAAAALVAVCVVWLVVQ